MMDMKPLPTWLAAVHYKITSTFVKKHKVCNPILICVFANLASAETHSMTLK